jgi:chromosome segregation ATPase
MTNKEPNWTTYALTADPGKPLREAKETIATLTGDIEMLNGIIKGLRQMLADVEPAKEVLEKDLNAAMEELHQHHELLKLMVDGATRVRAERDEARRELSERVADPHRMLHLDRPNTPHQVAKERGWDCFEGEQ